MTILRSEVVEAPPKGMLPVGAGPFTMGSTEGGEFERPLHVVELDAFWIDITPVTNSAFAEFVEATGFRTTAEKEGAAWGYSAGRYKKMARLSWRAYATPERNQHPVVLVSWEDAADYAAWAGKVLPTEAQWEKAARGGLESGLYPWGDATPDGSQSNFARAAEEMPGTSPVASHSPNGYGIYDMVGNVWQWCGDWYGADYYAQSPLRNPAGPSTGETKSRRGGAWNVIQPFRLRVANRGALPPQSVAPNLGFRCVWSSKTKPRATMLEPGKQAQNIENLPDSGVELVAHAEVERVLDTLRPAMEADGGGVRLVSVRGGLVEVELYGSCKFCPSQSLTLQLGLERTLKKELPWVEVVSGASRSLKYKY